ncbi:MAG: hypothetical protein QM759_05865 [Terricaulis sp.]
MRIFATVLAASVLLSAPVAFGQTDPATSSPAPAATTTPTEPSAAAPATPDAAQTQQQATDANNRVTCRVVQDTGSRLNRNRQRICGTRSQWEHMQDQNGDTVRGMGHVQQGQG